MLIVNAGSSSLKMDIYEDESPTRCIAEVSIENIGTKDATLMSNTAPQSDQSISAPVIAKSHDDATALCLEWLADNVGSRVASVGHRVVHGGQRFNAPVVIDDEVVTHLRSVSELAPNHMPQAIKCMDIVRKKWPEAVHVACFDTAFYANIPPTSRHFPLPRDFADDGIVRYGFHGLSYSYLLENFRQHEGDTAANGRVILLHLGSGASVSACSGGEPVDMSMGFTPSSGIVMSTRTGDMDPGALLYAMAKRQISVEAMTQIVSQQSGLKGLSGYTADMKQLLADQHGISDAALAVSMFCMSARKMIGAYAAEIGGVDSIIFAGGIGERSAEVRARILEGLEFMGIHVDSERNRHNDRLISSDDSAAGVHVIPTRENDAIARQVEQIVNKQ